MSNNPVTHAIAGAGGGVLAAIVTYPLITLSTRAQTAAGEQHVGNIEAVKRVLEKEGVVGLYAGLDSALYGMTLTNFVYYYFYEGIKGVYLSEGLAMSTARSMLTGAYSGVATAIITNPIWVVNTRMMIDGSKGTLGTIRSIIKENGFSTFFSGVGPALLLVINPVLNYTIYEQLRLVVEKTRPVTALDTFLLGALGKIVATSVTYPLITIKARLQLGKPQSAAGKSQPGKQTPLLKRLIMLWKSLSFSDLYRGWSLKVLQSALQSAFLFLFKEQLFLLAVAVLGLSKRVSRVAPPIPRVAHR
uniref:Mitochondrial Ymc1 n=1 Tax=Starmerella bombicola TaxID=75736 RepID=A0A6M8YH84_STABO|nr:mitochondrial Ymc1 [Starmerella bombicola]UJH94439.1 Pmp [Starmerella bombicola]